MELTYVGIAVLASMVFVLAGMVGYLYWQQTMILKNLRELAMMVASFASPPPPDTTQFFGVYENTEDFDKEHPVAEEKKEEETYSADDENSDDESVDDRLSVHDKVETVEGPPALEEKKTDVDDLQNRTVAQLRELLTEKGIPFGKRDPKTILIQLLKATA